MREEAGVKKAARPSLWLCQNRSRPSSRLRRLEEGLDLVLAVARLLQLLLRLLDQVLEPDRVLRLLGLDAVGGHEERHGRGLAGVGELLKQFSIKDVHRGEGSEWMCVMRG